MQTHQPAAVLPCTLGVGRTRAVARRELSCEVNAHALHVLATPFPIAGSRVSRSVSVNDERDFRGSRPAAEESAAGSRDDAGSARAEVLLVRSVSLSGIFFLMVLYTMYFAASLILPITLALLLNLLLSPVCRFMVSLRIPRTLSALIVMLSVAATMAAGVYALAAPAAEWMETLPTELRRLEYKLAWVKEPIKKVQETKEQVDRITNVNDDDAAPPSAQSGGSVSLVDAVLTETSSMLYGVSVMLILLFFLLASGDAFLKKMVQVTPTLADKKRVVETARDIQRHVSVYLGTITLINIGVGLVVAAAMYLLGLPNPLLWGAMLTVLNYIPYLGPLICIAVVAFVSLLTFHTPGQILLPPLVILAVNILEGQFITPILAGRRLSLSPVAVFLSLVVLGWIWGAIGVLIAVPMLVTIRLVCEHIEPLSPVATFLQRH